MLSKRTFQALRLRVAFGSVAAAHPEVEGASAVGYIADTRIQHSLCCGLTVGVQRTRAAPLVRPLLAHALDDDRGWNESHPTRMNAQGMAMVPTLRLFSGQPYTQYVLLEVQDFAAAGGRILFGTDVGVIRDARPATHIGAPKSSSQSGSSGKPRRHPLRSTSGYCGALRSPFEIDIYVWLIWRFLRLRKQVTIPWSSLQLQFGDSYKNPRHFKRRFLRYLKSVINYYPEVRLRNTDSGLMLRPSLTRWLNLGLQRVREDRQFRQALLHDSMAVRVELPSDASFTPRRRLLDALYTCTFHSPEPRILSPVESAIK